MSATTLVRVAAGLLFYVAWFLLVAGGAAGTPGAGYLCTLAIVALLLWSERTVWKPLVFLAGVAFAGTALEAILTVGRVYEFKFSVPEPWGYPLWMTFLWIAFAAVIRISMPWLVSNLYLATVLGAVGGPISYMVGERLGAISSVVSVPIFFLSIGLLWAIVTPAIALYARFLFAPRV